jgi:predicted esterase
VANGGSATGGGGGSGGSPVALGLPCDEPFTRGGVKGCLSEVKGHQVKFFPLPAGQQVKNLAVYLHGDLAGEWYDASAFPDIVEWAQPRSILVLGILSLAVGGDGLPRWGHAQTEHAEKTADTIEAFLDAYAASREKIFYWGVSGGSWFFTSSFIAHVGHRVPGIFAASCGGSGESWGWAWDPAQDTTTRGRIALLMSYGSEDFLAEDEAGSARDFESRGFTVEERVYPGAGHCQHAIDEPTLAFWSKFP